MKKFFFTLITVMAFGVLILSAQPNKCSKKFFERHHYLTGCDSLSSSSDISSDGSKVTGQSYFGDGSALHNCQPPHPVQATGWTRDCPSSNPFYPGGAKGLVGLGYVPIISASSLAYGISPDGLVTVGYSDDVTNNNYSKPVVFLPTIVKQLTFLHRTGTAKDVSNKNAEGPPVIGDWGNESALMQGRIIVGYSSEGVNHPHRLAGIGAHAAIWNSWTNCILLPIPQVLPNGKTVISSEAVCISDNGQVIGGVLYYNLQGEKENLRSYPCVWTFSGGIYVAQVLNDLPEGDTNARITHISGDGNIAVGWGTTMTGDSNIYAYPKFACKWIHNPSTGIWNNPEVCKSLDYKFASASGTNYDGSFIVGISYNYDPITSAHTGKAILWQGVVPHDIAKKIGKDIPAGKTLWEATRCSADGKIITGSSYEHDSDGFLTNQEGWTAGF